VIRASLAYQTMQPALSTGQSPKIEIQLTETKTNQKACGDNSAFCCRAKPVSGATHDMDKK